MPPSSFYVKRLARKDLVNRDGRDRISQGQFRINNETDGLPVQNGDAAEHT